MVLLVDNHRAAGGKEACEKYQRFLNLFLFLTLNFFSVVPTMECIIKGGYKTTLLVTTGAWFTVCIILGGQWMKLKSSKKQEKSKNAYKKLKQLVWITNVILPGLSRIISQGWNHLQPQPIHQRATPSTHFHAHPCAHKAFNAEVTSSTLKAIDARCDYRNQTHLRAHLYFIISNLPSSTPLQYLLVDHSIECSESSYQLILIYAILCLIIFPIGCPLGGGVCMRARVGR